MLRKVLVAAVAAVVLFPGEASTATTQAGSKIVEAESWSAADCAWMLETLRLDHQLDAATARKYPGLIDAGQTATLAAWAERWQRVLEYAESRCGGVIESADSQFMQWFRTAAFLHLFWFLVRDRTPADRAWDLHWGMNYYRLSELFV